MVKERSAEPVDDLKTSDKKCYVFDLEFFQEVRPFLYDYFHWHIGPLLYNIMKYGITIKLNNHILYILIKIFNIKVWYIAPMS